MRRRLRIALPAACRLHSAGSGLGTSVVGRSTHGGPSETLAGIVRLGWNRHSGRRPEGGTANVWSRPRRRRRGGRLTEFARDGSMFLQVPAGVPLGRPPWRLRFIAKRPVWPRVRCTPMPAATCSALWRGAMRMRWTCSSRRTHSPRCVDGSAITPASRAADGTRSTHPWVCAL